MTTEEARPINVNIRLGLDCPHCTSHNDDVLDEITTVDDLAGGYVVIECDCCGLNFEFCVDIEMPRFRSAAPSEGGNTLTIGATPEKYPLNKALSMDPSHVHLWTTGEEPDTFRCAECNTVGRLVMDSPRIRPADQSGGGE